MAAGAASRTRLTQEAVSDTIRPIGLLAPPRDLPAGQGPCLFTTENQDSVFPQEASRGLSATNEIAVGIPVASCSARRTK